MRKVENFKKRIMKTIVAATLCMTAILATIPVQAANKNETAAKAAATQFLKAAKTYNIDKMLDLQAKDLSYKIYLDGAKEEALCKKYFKQMYSYKITKVQTVKKDVKVTAKIIYPNAYYMSYTAIDEAFNYSMKHPKLSTDDVNKLYLKKLTNKLKLSGPDKEVITVTINLKHTKGGWKVNSISKNFNPVMVMEIPTAVDAWCTGAYHY